MAGASRAQPAARRPRETKGSAIQQVVDEAGCEPQASSTGTKGDERSHHAISP